MSISRAPAGIVRPARRPAGWKPVGPQPPAHVAPELGPREGEDLCYLTGDFRILQRLGGHRWSLDDLLTAHFAASFHTENAPTQFVDLGCGIGSVLMMLAWRFPEGRGVGLEAQTGSVDLARRSLRFNGLEDRCLVHHGDLRESPHAGGTFDLVTGTPPYFPMDAASGSDDGQRLACRLETRGGVEDYCQAAAPRLAPGARFVLCMPGGPDGRVGQGARDAGLAIECHRDVVPRAGKAPLFGLWSLRRSDEVQGTDVLSPLVVRDERSVWTQELLDVRRDMGMPSAHDP
ncbi:MAG: methyltransferase domain-containing protein [Candidatus Binatia bacterium]|nr:methyltransferase domain-containing protein [Candidatus Binatia bacterium]